MYATKEQDYEKRSNQEGSYSVYNHMYKYLMDNYEPVQVKNMPSGEIERKLMAVGKDYAIKGGNTVNDNSLVNDVRKAVSNFISNNGEHGDTSNKLGKKQQSSFDNIKRSIEDLRW